MEKRTTTLATTQGAGSAGGPSASSGKTAGGFRSPASPLASPELQSLTKVQANLKQFLDASQSISLTGVDTVSNLLTGRLSLSPITPADDDKKHSRFLPSETEASEASESEDCVAVLQQRTEQLLKDLHRPRAGGAMAGGERQPLQSTTLDWTNRSGGEDSLNSPTVTDHSPTMRPSAATPGGGGGSRHTPRTSPATDSSLAKENELLRQSVERERLRRKTCEKKIQGLHEKLLATQQQLAMALAQRRKREIMLQQLDKNLVHLATGWQQREEQGRDEIQRLSDDLEHVNVENLQKDERLEQSRLQLSHSQQALQEERKRTESSSQSHAAEVHRISAEHTATLQQLSAERQHSVEIEVQLGETLAGRNSLERRCQELELLLEETKTAVERQESEALSRERERYRLHEESTVIQLKTLQVELGSKDERLRVLKDDVAVLQQQHDSMAVEHAVKLAQTQTSADKAAEQIRVETDRELATKTSEWREQMFSAETKLREHSRQLLEDLHGQHQQELQTVTTQYQRELSDMENQLGAIELKYRERLSVAELALKKETSAKRTVAQEKSALSTQLQSILRQQCDSVIEILAAADTAAAGEAPLPIAASSAANTASAASDRTSAAASIPSRHMDIVSGTGQTDSRQQTTSRHTSPPRTRIASHSIPSPRSQRHETPTKSDNQPAAGATELTTESDTHRSAARPASPVALSNRQASLSPLPGIIPSSPSILLQSPIAAMAGRYARVGTAADESAPRVAPHANSPPRATQAGSPGAAAGPGAAANTTTRARNQLALLLARISTQHTQAADIRSADTAQQTGDLTVGKHSTITSSYQGWSGYPSASPVPAGEETTVFPTHQYSAFDRHPGVTDGDARHLDTGQSSEYESEHMELSTVSTSFVERLEAHQNRQNELMSYLEHVLQSSPRAAGASTSTADKRGETASQLAEHGVIARPLPPSLPIHQSSSTMPLVNQTPAAADHRHADDGNRTADSRLAHAPAGTELLSAFHDIIQTSGLSEQQADDIITPLLSQYASMMADPSSAVPLSSSKSDHQSAISRSLQTAHDSENSTSGAVRNDSISERSPAGVAATATEPTSETSDLDDEASLLSSYVDSSLPRLPSPVRYTAAFPHQFSSYRAPAADAESHARVRGSPEGMVHMQRAGVLLGATSQPPAPAAVPIPAPATSARSLNRASVPSARHTTDGSPPLSAGQALRLEEFSQDISRLEAAIASSDEAKAGHASKRAVRATGVKAAPFGGNPPAASPTSSSRKPPAATEMSPKRRHSSGLGPLEARTGLAQILRTSQPQQPAQVRAGRVGGVPGKASAGAGAADRAQATAAGDRPSAQPAATALTAQNSGAARPPGFAALPARKATSTGNSPAAGAAVRKPGAVVQKPGVAVTESSRSASKETGRRPTRRSLEHEFG